MKRLIFIIILFCSITSIFAQKEKTANDYLLKAKEAYKVKDYAKAFAAFESALNINKKENKVDTSLFYNTAYCAFKSKLYNKSAQYFNESIKLKYKALRSYLFQSVSYKRLKDYDNMEKTLKAGIKAYPNSSLLTKHLFNYYYNSGLKYYNRGSEILLKAAALAKKAPNKYTIEQKKANLEFKKSLPYMEKAYNLNSKNKNVLQALSSMYESIGMKKKENKIKAELTSL